MHKKYADQLLICPKKCTMYCIVKCYECFVLFHHPLFCSDYMIFILLSRCPIFAINKKDRDMIANIIYFLIFPKEWTMYGIVYGINCLCWYQIVLILLAHFPFFWDVEKTRQWHHNFWQPSSILCAIQKHRWWTTFCSYHIIFILLSHPPTSEEKRTMTS